MTLYLDIYFVTNAVADFLICCITGKVLHLKCVLWRLLCSAATGGIFSVISVVANSSLISVLAGILTPVLMIITSFGIKNIKEFLKCYTVMTGCCFASGGMIFAAETFLISQLKPHAVFALCFCIFFFCFYFFDLFCFSGELKTVEMIAETEHGTKKLKLICDSGCFVREPIGGLPVILLSPKVFDSLYPNEEKDANYAIKNKQRAVPIKTAAGCAVIYAVKPKNLTYTHSGKEKQCNALLGRSNSDSFSGTDGIFPQSLL